MVSVCTRCSQQRIISESESPVSACPCDQFVHGGSMSFRFSAVCFLWQVGAALTCRPKAVDSVWHEVNRVCMTEETCLSFVKGTPCNLIPPRLSDVIVVRIRCVEKVLLLSWVSPVWDKTICGQSSQMPLCLQRSRLCFTSDKNQLQQHKIYRNRGRDWGRGGFELLSSVAFVTQSADTAHEAPKGITGSHSDHDVCVCVCITVY